VSQFKRKWSLDRQKFLAEPEVKKLKRVVQDKAIADMKKGRTTWPRFWMVIDLAISAGMRVSEIASLKIGQLHLNPREPRLHVTGKGEKARDIFISKELMKHLSEYLLWKRLLGESMDEEEALLWSSHGKPYTTRALQYAFKVALRQAGLPTSYSIHACRHSYGTYLYQKTKNLRLVQKQLGHSSITTTTVYADVTVEETVDAVNGLFEEGGDEKDDPAN
jgi:site-specific recombinase XerD